MDGIQRLKLAFEKKDQEAQDKQKFTEQQLTAIDTQQVIVKSFLSLVEYLDGRVSKTEVTNQLQSIATPDALKVAEAVESLHETLRDKNVDLSEVVKALEESSSKVVDAVSSIPTPELPEQIDHTKQFEALTKAIECVEKAVKAQETHVEAPTVNVQAPDVHIPEIDLKPLTGEINKAFTKAINSIVYPEYIPTDIQPLVEEQKKTNKLLKELPDKMPSSSGGSVSLSSYQDENGIPQRPTLEGGAVPVSTNPLGRYIVADEEETATYAYTGFEGADGGWYIMRETLASGSYRYSAGTSAYSTAWTNRASQTYGYPSEVF